MKDELFCDDTIVIKLDNEKHNEAKEFLDKVFSDDYQEKYPCPKCGSHNVDIDIGALGDGHVCGIEWCNSCKWEKETNTFPKEG